MADGYDALTEKEKETLRLMVRGHDAKSAASALDLSVHTINERLRAARRKLQVTSSREAARLVLGLEGPENPVDEELGDASAAGQSDDRTVSETRRTGGWGKRRVAALLVGGVFMSMITAALFLVTPLASDGAVSPDAEATLQDVAIEAAARRWLELGDAGDWQASYEATGASFRTANSLARWTEAAEQVRAPLGAVGARTLVTIRYLNAPPSGFQEVTFRSQFASKANAVETVTLVKEDGEWKVVGVLMD